MDCFSRRGRLFCAPPTSHIVVLGQHRYGLFACTAWRGTRTTTTSSASLPASLSSLALLALLAALRRGRRGERLGWDRRFVDAVCCTIRDGRWCEQHKQSAYHCHRGGATVPYETRSAACGQTAAGACAGSCGRTRAAPPSTVARATRLPWQHHDHLQRARTFSVTSPAASSGAGGWRSR